MTMVAEQRFLAELSVFIEFHKDVITLDDIQTILVDRVFEITDFNIRTEAECLAIWGAE